MPKSEASRLKRKITIINTNVYNLVFIARFLMSCIRHLVGEIGVICLVISYIWANKNVLLKLALFRIQFTNLGNT